MVEVDGTIKVVDYTDYGRIHKEKNWYEYNEDVTLTAIPREGYNFIGWYEDDTLLSDSLEYSFKMKKQNMAIRFFLTGKMEQDQFILQLYKN